MKNEKLFLLLAFFFFSWGWSGLLSQDSFYYAPSQTNAPDTIYVIEPEVPTYPQNSIAYPNEAKNEWLIYVHPTSLIYSVLNKSFLGYVTLEKELSEKFSLLILPSFVSHEIEIANSYDYFYDRYDPYKYSFSFKINQLKVGSGFRMYTKKDKKGFYLQLDADVFIGRTKSLDSNSTQKNQTYYGASITSSMGVAFKYKSFVWFIDTGLALQTSTLNRQNYDNFEQLMILNIEPGFTSKLNLAIGFYLN